jgi:hypothetical protein
MEVAVWMASCSPAVPHHVGKDDERAVGHPWVTKARPGTHCRRRTSRAYQWTVSVLESAGDRAVQGCTAARTAGSLTGRRPARTPSETTPRTSAASRTAEWGWRLSLPVTPVQQTTSSCQLGPTAGGPTSLRHSPGGWKAAPPWRPEGSCRPRPAPGRAGAHCWGVHRPSAWVRVASRRCRLRLPRPWQRVPRRHWRDGCAPLPSGAGAPRASRPARSSNRRPSTSSCAAAARGCRRPPARSLAAPEAPTPSADAATRTAVRVGLLCALPRAACGCCAAGPAPPVISPPAPADRPSRRSRPRCDWQSCTCRRRTDATRSTGLSAPPGHSHLKTYSRLWR